jgi:hypothetical protein
MVKNCQLRIFDRSDITKNASGVTTKVYEVRHPESIEGSNTALSHRGTANHAWTEFTHVVDTPNEVTPLSFTDSPGASGLNGNSDTDQANGGLTSGIYTFQGAGHQSLRHDWYAALSASPNEIGSKTDFGLYFSSGVLLAFFYSS